MSLYDGLAVETAPVPELSGKYEQDPPPSKKQTFSSSEQEGTVDKAEWTAKMKMLQSQLHRSKATRGGGTGRGGRGGRGGASRGRVSKAGAVSVQVCKSLCKDSQMVLCDQTPPLLIGCSLAI